MNSSVTGNFTAQGEPFEARLTPTPTAADADLTGTVLLGRYLLEQRIDAGSSGTVYRAHDSKRRRLVAVKVLHARHARKPHIVDAFSAEAQAAERMIHPNLVQLYAFGQDPSGYLCIVMELLKGRTLEQLLSDMPRPPIDWTIQVVAQVLAALDAAHDAGVVHRDAKPANVFILNTRSHEGPKVKLCDFGVARIRRSSRELDGARRRRRTAGDRIWGTPEYMAPEQARAESVDRTTDIYACGVMLYEMVTGHLPFEVGGPREIALQHVEREATPPSRLRPDLDPALEAIILQAMSKDPALRFRNAQAMRSALLSLRDTGATSGPERTRRFRTNRS